MSRTDSHIYGELQRSGPSSLLSEGGGGRADRIKIHKVINAPNTSIYIEPITTVIDWVCNKWTGGAPAVGAGGGSTRKERLYELPLRNQPDSRKTPRKQKSVKGVRAVGSPD